MHLPAWRYLRQACRMPYIFSCFEVRYLLCNSFTVISNVSSISQRIHPTTVYCRSYFLICLECFVFVFAFLKQMCDYFLFFCFDIFIFQYCSASFFFFWRGARRGWGWGWVGVFSFQPGHGFEPPLGKFSGRGDFSLGVNTGSNSIPPKKTLSDETEV